MDGVHHGGGYVLHSQFSFIRSPNLSVASDDRSLNAETYKIVPVLNQATCHEGIIFKLST